MNKWKQRLKRVGAAGLALAITLALVPAGASKAAEYDPNATGTVTIHKYGVDDKVKFTPKEGSAVGTVVGDDEVIGYGKDKEPLTLNDLKALEGVDFRWTEVTLKPGAPAGSVDVNDYIKVPHDVPETDPFRTQTTDANGVATFPDLPVGIYLFEEIGYDNTKVGEDIRNPVSPFIVQVPMTNPDGDGFNYDIHVYPKNELDTAFPTIHKYVTELENFDDGKNIKENTKWLLTTSIPRKVGDAKEYIITDKNFDPILRYTDKNEAIKLSYVDPATGNRVYLTKDTHYAFEYTEVNSKTASDEMKITLTAEGRREIAKVWEGVAANDPTPVDRELYMTIEFETYFAIEENGFTRQEIYDSYLGKEITNTAELYYKDAFDNESTDTSEEPEVHTGGVAILKTDMGSRALEGAEFKIYPTKEDAAADTNWIAVLGADANGVVKSNEKGIVVFAGLAYGDVGDQNDSAYTMYWIKETKSPEGYELLKDPVEVRVDKDSHKVTAETDTVKNAKKFELPLTGGVGTTIFTIAGIMAILAAFIIYGVAKKRKNA